MGFSCFCPPLHLEVAKSIDNRASIFTAECIALSNALDIIIQNPGLEFLVFSDSLSALQSLKAVNLKIKNNPFILEIKKNTT